MVERRDFLRQAGGLGCVAAQWLTATESDAAPLRPAKAKRVIQLFMNGGASQMDLFDHKPVLLKKHGQKFDPGANQRVEAALDRRLFIARRSRGTTRRSARRKARRKNGRPLACDERRRAR